MRNSLEPKKEIDRDIWSTFLNGIKQGKGFSCPVATVVGAFIIRIWKKSRRATATTEAVTDGALQYTLNAVHHADGQKPSLDAISYSDDQSRILGFRYNGPNSLPHIQKTVQGFLDTIGAFTIVTKTSRQALKSCIRLLPRAGTQRSTPTTPCGLTYRPPNLGWHHYHHRRPRTKRPM